MNNMEINNLMNADMSYADKCGWYYAENAELIVAAEGSSKNDSIRFSLKKFGRSSALSFSHYFNVGMPKQVAAYKALGVTEDGISTEDLEKANKRWEQAFDKRGKCVDPEAMPFEFYGTWWNIEFPCEMKNRTTGKVTTSTSVFVLCDEETGVPQRDYVVNSERLARIMAGYEPVGTQAEISGEAEGVESPEEELARRRREAEEFLKNNK
jgi:hypothetical protein